MASGADRHVLVLNAGSSSLKLALYANVRPLRRLLSAMVGRIGQARATLTLVSSGAPPVEEELDAKDHASSLDALLDRVGPAGGLQRVAAVGHRIVHGGPLGDRARPIGPDLYAELRRMSALDPEHMPVELAIVEAVGVRAPSLPQVACFDTAFHRTMPKVATMLALPRRLEAEGVRRYGFHGLSYEFLMQELERLAGPDAAGGKVVLAHLGAGASLAAVLGRRCVDTTMGFTPTSGVMMGTRSGDLDPGVLLYLMRTSHMGPDGIDELVNRRAGLLGVSESSSDMRDLLAREADDPRAAEAIELFCHQARKAIGALAATLGGIDTLVFSGGIGERAAPIRERIALHLEHLGVRVDPAKNHAGADVISVDGSGCTVRVIRTDEESIIARETMDVLEAG